MLATALDVNQAQIRLLHLVAEESDENLVGVGKFLINMVSGMAALQAVNSHLEKIVILWQPFAFIRESGRCSGTARAAHENLPLVFRVEIDE